MAASCSVLAPKRAASTLRTLDFYSRPALAPTLRAATRLTEPVGTAAWSAPESTLPRCSCCRTAVTLPPSYTCICSHWQAVCNSHTHAHKHFRALHPQGCDSIKYKGYVSNLPLCVRPSLPLLPPPMWAPVLRPSITPGPSNFWR